MNYARQAFFCLNLVFLNPVECYNKIMKNNADEINKNKIRSKLICFNDYYASEGARDLAHRAKAGDDGACIEIAHEIAASVRFPANAVLVPIPSSSGVAGNNLLICEEIASRLGLKVADCIEGKQREKLYDLKKQGVDVKSDFFGFGLKDTPPIGTYFLFDIVVDKASTMLAAKSVFKDKATFCIAHSMVGLNQERNRTKENNSNLDLALR